MPLPLLQYYRDALGARDAGPEKTAVVLILDSGGRFLRWNHAAEALTGRSKTEMVGHVLWGSLLFQEDIQPFKCQFERILSGYPGSLEYRWKIRGGAARWMACANFEACVFPGGVECLAFTATDVTESRHSRDWRSSLFDAFVHAREAERYEFSRFLHDTVAQNLVALSFSLEQAERDAALELVGRCCQDIRLLGYLLAPPVLGDNGLTEAIEWHARTLRESGALDINFRPELAPESLSPQVRAALFSAVHEFTAKAITNGAGKRLHIVLRRDGPSVVLEIIGVLSQRGFGDRDYPVMREQVGALGGRLELMPDSVRIALPAPLAATAA